MNLACTAATVLFGLATSVLCAAAPGLIRETPSGQALFAAADVPQMRIDIPAGEWEQLRRGNRSYVRAVVEIGTNQWRDVGVRLKGHGSFQPREAKPSLAVKFNEFIPRQSFDGLTRILLNNASQDTTLLSEYIAAGMFHDAGVPAARVTHARVRLNSRDLGFYVVAEGMNKVFLQQHFNDAGGNLYEANAQDIDGPLTQSNGPPGDRSDLAALLAATRLPPAERAAKLPQYLDVDRFASFLAVSILAAHHDSYPFNRNNYRLYRPSDTNRFVMLPHGIDGSFSRVHLPIQLPARYVLTKAMAGTPEFEKTCRERVGLLFTNVFNLETLSNRIYTAARRLQNAATNEPERANILTRANGFARKVLERHRSVAAQLAGTNATPLVMRPGSTLPLTNWIAEVERGNATLDAVMSDNRRALHIQTSPMETTASWRQRIALAPGAYRFRVQARFASARPGPSPAGTPIGIALRISGRPVPPRKIPADAWTPLDFAFVIHEGEEDVQFVCECRGENVHAWFDLDSLLVQKE